VSKWKPFDFDDEPPNYWNPHGFYRDEMFPLFIPKLKLDVDANGQHTLLTEECQKLYDFNLEGGERLRQKSLFLCPAKSDDDDDTFPKKEEKKGRSKKAGNNSKKGPLPNMLEVMDNFNGHLTSLILHGLKLSADHLQQILASSPNLKALIIWESSFYTKDGENVDQPNRLLLFHR